MAARETKKERARDITIAVITGDNNDIKELISNLVTCGSCEA